MSKKYISEDEYQDIDYELSVIKDMDFGVFKDGILNAELVYVKGSEEELHRRIQKIRLILGKIMNGY
jgi:hypothetical protein